MAGRYPFQHQLRQLLALPQDKPVHRPGTYDINVTFNAADNPNYSINVTKGTFTIVAPDTILATVGNVTKVYDGTTAFPTTSLPKVTLSGTNTVMPTFTHDDFDWSKVQANAGSYQVTLNTNGLKKITDANKGAAASATNGDAIVTKAAITIKANDGTKVDGQKDPDLTATVTGQPTAGIPEPLGSYPSASPLNRIRDDLQLQLVDCSQVK